MNAVDWVPDILSGGHDHGECEKNHGGDAPMEAKNRAVDVYVGDFDQSF